MKNIRKDISSLLGMLGSLSVAVLTTGIAAPTLLDMVRNIGMSIPANLISELSPSRARKWFSSTHPNNLNHSIVKLFITSFQDALSNIRVLFQESNAAKDEKKAVNKIISQLHKAIDTNFINSNFIDESIIKKFISAGNTEYENIERLLDELLKRDGVDDSFSIFYQSIYLPRYNFVLEKD